MSILIALIAVCVWAGFALADEPGNAVPGKPDAMHFAQRAAQSIKDLFPESMQSAKFLTIAAWQWAGLGAIALVALAASTLTRFIASRTTARIAGARGVTLQVESVRRTVAPLGILVGSIAWLMFLPALELTEGLTGTLLLLTRLVATFSGVRVALRLVDLIAEGVRRGAEGRGMKVNLLLQTLVTRTVKIALLAMGVVYVADALNVQILPLLTGLGIGGLAMALAAKDTVENVFGSVSVIVDQPFQPGDTVRIGDVEGVVVSVGLRSTRVRTPRGAMVTMPNASLVRANVENRGRRPTARMAAVLSVRCDTPADQLADFAARVREAALKDPGILNDDLAVTIVSGNPGRFDVSVLATVDLSDGQTEPDHRQRMFVEMVRLCEQTGVKPA